MKILHLDPDDIDNPFSGGGPVRNYEIYRRLARRHEITVLTPTFEGSTSEKIRDGIRYLRLGRKIRNHGSSHHITFFFCLPKAVRTMDYDLLIEDFMPPMSTTFNPLFAKAPLIASVQWFFAEALSRQYKLPFFLGERYGVKTYKNFIVLTEKMRELIQSRNRKANLRVIPNGVDSNLFELNAEFGDFILFLGRVDPLQKGVDLLLQAYAKVPEAKKIPLVLAGHSFHVKEIQGLIDSLGITKWVKMTGKVGVEEKSRLLSECRFVCVPSREETFGMVITESCACGKSVILFDKSPMNEVASKSCVKVKPFDVDQYAEAIGSLLDATESGLIEKSLECRTWARQYDWDSIAKQQELFYKEAYARGLK
jgi:glycosyltransferase involved in cell wall biosynthesis